MASQALTYKPILARKSLTHIFLMKCASLVQRITPRPQLLSSAGLLLVGLGIPFLMLLEMVPVTLFLGFASLALIAVGGLLLLCTL